jgi:uncharacterized membrane protein YphA (DoxX/SURF4 family)
LTTATAPRSRHQSTAPWVSTVARLVLAAVFLAAGTLKAIDPSGSVAAVRAYELVPAGLETLIGWGLPFLEIGLGLLLALGLQTRAVAIFSAALLATLIAAVVSVAARGLSIDCGCFGGGGPVPPGETRYPSEIIRDAGLLLLAGWLIWRPRSRFSLDRWDGETR